MKESLFNELMESVREGARILRGDAAPSRTFELNALDVQRIREGYALSQAQFAAMLGISSGTLRNWEQGRRSPQGPARVLLQIASKHPDAVWDVVQPPVHLVAKRKRSKSSRSRSTRSVPSRA